MPTWEKKRAYSWQEQASTGQITLKTSDRRSEDVTTASRQGRLRNVKHLPAGPRIPLGLDYFEWNGSRYLLIADYYSRFPVLRSVTNMTATNLVTTLKTLFSE